MIRLSYKFRINSIAKGDPLPRPRTARRDGLAGKVELPILS